MKTPQTLLIGAALATASLPARAGGPMPQGTFAIGAERLMGITHADAKDTDPGGSVTASATAFTLLGNGGAGVASVGRGNTPALDARGLYTIPRVGLDYFIIPGLSLGGSLTLIHVSTSFTDERGLTTNNGSTTGWLFAPRVGYAYMFGDVVGIWPRGGLSYAHDSEDPNDPTLVGSGGHVFAFDLDVPLLIAPVKNFAITVGPTFDITFGGSHGPDPYPRGDPIRPDHDIALTMFGLSAGVVGLL